MTRRWRTTLRVLAISLLVLVVTVGLLLALVMAPPSALLRPTLVKVAERVLGYDALVVDDVRVRLGLRGRIDLEGVRLRPPKGYRLSPLSFERLSVAYDASQFRSGKVTVRHIELVRPELRLEQRHGKLNLMALLQGLASKSSAVAQAKAAKPPPQAAEPGAASLAIRVDRFIVDHLSASFDAPGRRAAVGGLSLRAVGQHGPNGSSGQLTVTLAPASGSNSNLSLALEQPQPVKAELAVRVKLGAKLAALRPLRATVDLGVQLASQTIIAPWHLPPLTLAIDGRATANQREAKARLHDLSLSFNGQQLLSAKGQVTEPQTDPKLDLKLQQLTLPIDALIPYVRLVMPQLLAGGRVALKDVRLQGRIAALAQALPRLLTGELELSQLWATLQAKTDGAAQLAVKGISGKLRFTGRQRPNTDRQPALGVEGLMAHLQARKRRRMPVVSLPVAAQGEIRLASLRAAGAQVEHARIELAAAAAVDGLQPTCAALRARVLLPHLRYRDRALGRIHTRIRTDLLAGVDLTRRRAKLGHLRVAVDDVVALSLKASAKDYGQQSLRAQLRLAPVVLGKLMQRLPRALRQQLPLRSLEGRVALRAAIAGRLPRPDTPPLRLPLRLDAKLELTGIGLQQRQEQGARIKNLNAKLELTGRVPQLRLKGQLGLGRLRHPASGLSLSSLELPLDVQLTRRGINVELQAKVQRIQQHQGARRLDQKRLSLRTDLQAQVPWQRLLAERPASVNDAELRLEAGLGQLVAQLPGRMAIRGLHARLQLTHKPAQPQPVTWQLRVGLDEFVQRQPSPLTVGGAVLTANGQLGGVALSLPTPVFDFDVLEAGVKSQLGIDRVSLSDTLPRDLRHSQFTLDLRLPTGGSLSLRRCALRLPTYGMRVNLSGDLRDPLVFAMAPAGLPSFAVQLQAALDNPRTRKAQQGIKLLDGIRTAGKVGLLLRVRNRGRERLRLGGRLVAHAFRLWHQSRRPDDSGEGRQRQSTVQLENLNADVPFEQEVVLTKQAPGFTLPAPAHSIFDRSAVGAAYRAVRPFTRRRANFTIDRLSMRDELIAHDTLSSQTLSLGPVIVDMRFADSTVELNQLYVRLFDGDILGSLLVQLPQLSPPDVRLRVDTQLTNVDLAYLDPAAKARGERTRLSALARVRYEMGQRKIAGRVLLSDLTLETLDRLLAYLDPHKLDASIQANRRLINSWYTRLANPEVQKVSVWLDHSQLNLDIKLGALWPIGSILRQAMSRLRIRRVSVKPFLPAPKGADVAAAKRHSARRPWGSLAGP